MYDGQRDQRGYCPKCKTHQYLHDGRDRIAPMGMVHLPSEDGDIYIASGSFLWGQTAKTALEANPEEASVILREMGMVQMHDFVVLENGMPDMSSIHVVHFYLDKLMEDGKRQ